MTTTELPEDIFGRADIATRMCDVIANTEQQVISPLVLDGAWGSGKTVHAKRMYDYFCRAYKDQVKCISWNAAAFDFSTDPLPSFAAALYNAVDEQHQGDYVQQAISMCFGAVLGASLNVTSQLIKNAVGVELNQVIDSARLGANVICGESNMKQMFGEFLKTSGKEQLRIDAARSLIQMVKGNAQQLIIIIDELDRCRPDFALKMIESIKHLFDSTECKFVLIMNKFSIICSIQHLYAMGEEDAESYLSKYIKTEFHLPRNVIKPPINHSELCSEIYFNNLLQKNEVCLSCDNQFWRGFVLYVIENKFLQLRDLEKWVKKIKFIQASIPKELKLKRSEYFDCLICFLGYLLEFHQRLAIQIYSKEVGTSDIMDAIGCGTDSTKLTMSDELDSVKYIRFVLDYFFANNQEEKENMKQKLGILCDWDTVKEGSIIIDCWLTYAIYIR